MSPPSAGVGEAICARRVSVSEGGENHSKGKDDMCKRLEKLLRFDLY
jgi:hypothetical protein